MVERSPYLTVQEVADHLRVSVKTVYQMCQRGQLDWLRAGSRKGVRITRASVDRLLRSATDLDDSPVAAVAGKSG